MAASEGVRRGVRYALGRGLDPRLKDGVRAHPWTFGAGMLLHAGIAAAFLSLVLLPAPGFRLLLIGLAATGALAGGYLLIRRLREPVLRAISVPDDYISNVLVIALLAAAIASLVDPARRSWLLVAGAVLLVYAPFGKIRHCVLFFVSRARFGAFIGTRGVVVGRSRQ